MNLARRFAPALLLGPVLLATAALTGCSSDSGSDAAPSTDCVDATLPNATAEEIVDSARPQPAGDPDDMYRTLVAQFEETRSAQIQKVSTSAVFTAVPEGGDAAFAKAVCGQSRWNDRTAADGSPMPGLRSQRAVIVSTGHTFCDTYEQLKPSAVATGAWTDWNGYVEMMARGDDGADTQQLADAARANICPQLG